MVLVSDKVEHGNCDQDLNAFEHINYNLSKELQAWQTEMGNA